MRLKNLEAILFNLNSLLKILLNPLFIIKIFCIIEIMPLISGNSDYNTKI